MGYVDKPENQRNEVEYISKKVGEWNTKSEQELDFLQRYCKWGMVIYIQKVSAFTTLPKGSHHSHNLVHMEG